MTLPPGKTVEVAGRRLFYAEAGEGRPGTPIVLLHGIPTSSYLYRNIMPVLATERHVVAPDFLGFGRSEKPRHADYRFEAQRERLARFMDALGLRKVILAVHDMGGPIGLDWASRHPDRLAGLVVLNTTVYKRGYRPPPPALLLFTPGVRHLVWPIMTRPLFVRFFRKYGLGNPAGVPDDVVETHWRLAMRDGGARAVFWAWARFPDSFRQMGGIRTRVKTIRVPTLVVWGEKDPMLPGSIAARFAEDIPGAEVHRIPGAGHFLQEDAPTEVAETIRDFLKRKDL